VRGGRRRRNITGAAGTGQPKKNWRGTDGSNPSPCSGESDANLTSSSAIDGMADCAGASYSAIPCSTARHSESSAISVSSVAQILSCWMISGSTAVFSKSRHRLASPKIWLTSRISIPQLDYILRQVKNCLYSTLADRDEMLSYIGNQHLFLIQEDYNSY
jgi:hypothetical protein